MNNEDFKIVRDYNGDWAGFYHKAVLVLEGHISDVNNEVLRYFCIKQEEITLPEYESRMPKWI